MLELVAATIVISVALVPALKYSRSSIEDLERIERGEQCHLLCVSKLEEVMAQASNVWSLAAQSGDFTTLGWSQFRYQVSFSDLPSDGGISDSLMVIRVRVWFDENRNGTLDAAESNSRLDTKLAKLLTLQGNN
jgi:hypothetical protein